MITHVQRLSATPARTTDQRIGHRTRPQGATDRHPSRREREWLAEHVGEYVFATVNGRYEVHVIRRRVRAWAVRLGGFALHADGCFWTAPDAHPAGRVSRTEPTYPLDEAIARALQALARLP